MTSAPTYDHKVVELRCIEHEKLNRFHFIMLLDDALCNVKSMMRNIPLKFESLIPENFDWCAYIKGEIFGKSDYSKIVAKLSSIPPIPIIRILVCFEKYIKKHTLLAFICIST